MMLIGSLDDVFFATLVFVGGHFALSSPGLRDPLRHHLGAQGFTLTYSLLAGVSLFWMAAAYGAAPTVPVWSPPAALAWFSLAIMAPATFFVVTALTTRSPTRLGGEGRAALDPIDPLPGVLRITRHPFLCGAALWALAHLLVRGDLASIVVFGGIMILSLGGMSHIDQKREAEMGAAWGPIAMTSSRMPFLAIATRRTKMDWKGLGWQRPVLALVVYLALVAIHPVVFGVSALPL